MRKNEKIQQERGEIKMNRELVENKQGEINRRGEMRRNDGRYRGERRNEIKTQ